MPTVDVLNVRGTTLTASSLPELEHLLRRGFVPVSGSVAAARAAFGANYDAPAALETYQSDALRAAFGAVAGVFDVTKAPYSVVNDAGDADQSAKIQAALDAAATAGGGLVLLPPWTVQATNLRVGTWVSLWGCGRSSTLLAPPASSTPVITNVDRAYSYNVANLRVDGNQQNGAATGKGIYFSNTAQVAAPRSVDVECRVTDVDVYNCGSHGIQFASSNKMAAAELRGFHVRRCLGIGLVIQSTDVQVSDGTVATCKAGGVYIDAPSGRYSNVKTFFSGYSTVSGTSSFTDNSAGWYLSTQAVGCLVTGCESQDDGFHGLAIDGTDNMIDMKINAPNQRGNGQGAVLNLFSSAVRNNIRIIELPADFPSTFDYVNVTGDGTGNPSTGAVNNRVQITYATAPTGGKVRVRAYSGGSVSANAIEFNQESNRYVRMLPGSTTLQVLRGRYMAVLTANLTIVDSVDLLQGDVIDLVLTQDATGGRTVTFPASFRNAPTIPTAANASVYIRALRVFDGVNSFWVCNA